MRSSFQTILLIALFLGAGIMQAQTLPAALSLSATPSSPSPGESFTVQANTPSADSTIAFFNWAVDGKARQELSGFGKKDINLTAGGLGSLTRISVFASQGGKPLGSASLSVRPADLALTWVAETLIPRWYKGKALPVPSSVVNIIAVPQIVVGGKTLSPRNLVYRWGLDDEERILEGAGEDIFRIKTSDFPRSSHRITVAVEDINRTVKKTGEIFINPVSPQLAIYASTPLGGVEPRAAHSFFFTELRGLMDFIAEPFFFPVKSRKELSFRWSVAGNEVAGTPENPHVLTLDTNQRQPGEVLVEARVNWGAGLIPLTSARSLTLFLQ